MSYSVYILRSVSSDKFYIGCSEDPIRRLSYHDTIERGFTSRYRPWDLVFRKDFSTKSEALAAEHKMKSWKSREMIQKLLQGEIEI